MSAITIDIDTDIFGQYGKPLADKFIRDYENCTEGSDNEFAVYNRYLECKDQLDKLAEGCGVFLHMQNTTSRGSVLTGWKSLEGDEIPVKEQFKHDIKAVCTYGERYDITIDAPNFRAELFGPTEIEDFKHVVVNSWKTGMSLKKAKELYAELGSAISKCEELEVLSMVEDGSRD